MAKNGIEWAEALEKELYTPVEIEENNLQAKLICALIDARQAEGKRMNDKRIVVMTVQTCPNCGTAGVKMVVQITREKGKLTFYSWCLECKKDMDMTWTMIRHIVENLDKGN